MKGFYKKEESGAIAQANEIHTPDGSFNEENKSDVVDGWEWFDTAEEAYAKFAAPKGVTKLTIMLRLDALGKWDTFKGLLTQLPQLTQDAWALAQDVKADDPMFLQYSATLKGALSLTDEQFDTLLTP